MPWLAHVITVGHWSYLHNNSSLTLAIFPTGAHYTLNYGKAFASHKTTIPGLAWPSQFWLLPLTPQISYRSGYNITWALPSHHSSIRSMPVFMLHQHLDMYITIRCWICCWIWSTPLKLTPSCILDLLSCIGIHCSNLLTNSNSIISWMALTSDLDLLDATNRPLWSKRSCHHTLLANYPISHSTKHLASNEHPT